MTRKEYLKQYYLKNREKYNERSKEYYKNNRERCLMLNEEWRAVNKQYIRKYKHELYKKKSTSLVLD